MAVGASLDEMSAQIQNSINASGALFSVTGYTPSNYAAGDIYMSEGGAGLSGAISFIKKNPILFLVVIFLIIAFFGRGRR